MITKNDLVPFILKVEPEFEGFCKKEREYWKMETANRDMASLSIYVEGKLKEPDYSTVNKLFDAIEFLLIDNNADIEVQNAVCASFLENLLNLLCGR